MATSKFDHDIQKWVDEIMKNTRNLSTETELKEQARVALKLFLDSDENNDGALSFEELKKLCDHAGLPMGDDEEDMLKKIDIDNSNTLDIQEWTNWWLKRVSVLPNPIKQQEAIARNTFKLYDTSGDGYLNVSELGILVAKLGAEFSESELEEALKEIDEDQSGFIDVEEFIIWWSQRAAGNRKSSSLISLKMRNLAKKAAQVFAADPFIAAWTGDLDLMKALIEADKRLAKSTDESDYGGQWTVLQYACYQGHVNIVQALLDVIDTAHINQVNALGFTALFYAAQRGHIEICKLLLNKQADPCIAGEQVSPLTLISATNASIQEEKCQVDNTNTSSSSINTQHSQNKIFMCPIEHILTYPELKQVFALNPKCIAPNLISPTSFNTEIYISNGILSFELIGTQRNISYLPIKYWYANLDVKVVNEIFAIEYKDILHELNDLSLNAIKIPGKLEAKMITNPKLLEQMRTTFDVILDKTYIKKLQFLYILYKIKNIILLKADIYVLEEIWITLLNNYRQVDVLYREYIDLYELLINILKNSPDQKNASVLRTNLLYSLESYRAKKLEQKAKKSSVTPKETLNNKDIIKTNTNNNSNNTTNNITSSVYNSNIIEFIDEIDIVLQELKVKSNLKNKSLNNNNNNNNNSNNNKKNTQWMIENLIDKPLFNIQIELAADNIWGISNYSLNSPVKIYVTKSRSTTNNNND